MLIFAASVAMLHGIALAWLWYGWSTERPHIKAIVRAGAWVKMRPVHRFAPKCLPRCLHFLADRACEVGFPSSLTPATDVELEHVSHLKQVDLVAMTSPHVTYTGLLKLATLRDLGTINIAGSSMSDADLIAISNMKQLRVLDLSWTDVSNDGLRHLRGLDLVALNLLRTRITDDGLKNLTGMTNLVELNLADTAVTDAALDDIKCLPHLEKLVLFGTRATDAGIACLRQKMPQLKIGPW